jgi:hypothetical protein
MVELVEPAKRSSTLVLVVESSVVLVEASTKLMPVLVSSSTLELVEAAMLVEVRWSTLVADAPLVADTDDSVSADTEVATDPELWSSPAPSLDAHATPTRRRAVATAVNTPSIFRNI